MCFGSDGKAWIVGDAGIIEGAIESDNLRALSFTSTPRPLNSVACDDAQQVWAVGDGGLIMRYRQRQWLTTVYENGRAYFTKVKVVGPNLWLAGGTAREGQVGNNGLLVSSRNGLDWEDNTPNAAGTLYDLDFKGIDGWVVGAGGAIYHTSNGGFEWAKQPGPTDRDLMAIYLLNERRVWIGGDRLTVLGLTGR